MNQRAVKKIRDALYYPAKGMSADQRKRFRLAKRLYLAVPRPERGGYLQGLERVSRQIIEAEQQIAEEKALQAAEAAAEQAAAKSGSPV